MTIYRRRDGRTVSEDEALDEDGLLRDGFSVSVPLMLRDGKRRIGQETRDPQGRLISTSVAEEEELDDAATVTALADAGVAFHDGYGRPAGHRPGYCIPTDPDMVRRRALVRDVYAEVAERDANAWRDPRPWGGAAALPAETPDHLTADALSALALVDAKEAAYREVEERDRNAWRNAKP
jgi:hypothetical protein